MKKFSRYFVSFMILGVLFFKLLLSDLNPMFKNESYISFKNEISKNKLNYKKQETFLQTYERLYPFENFSKSILNNLVGDHKNNEYPSRELVCRYLCNIGESRLNKSINVIIYTLKIEKEFSQKEIFAYRLMHYDFCFEKNNIMEASRFYFNKDITQLTKNEQIALALVVRNPFYNNPIRHKDRLQKQIRKVLKRFN